MPICKYSAIEFKKCNVKNCPAFIGKKHESGCYFIKCGDNTNIIDLAIGFNKREEDIKQILNEQMKVIQQTIALLAVKDYLHFNKIKPDKINKELERRFLKTKAAKAAQMEGWEINVLKQMDIPLSKFKIKGKALYYNIMRG